MDSLTIGEACSNEQIAHWEGYTFEHDIPEGALERDFERIWVDDEGTLYQLHVDEGVLMGGFVTVYASECRMSFVVHPCEGGAL